MKPDEVDEEEEMFYSNFQIDTNTVLFDGFYLMNLLNYRVYWSEYARWMRLILFKLLSHYVVVKSSVGIN